MRNKALNLLLLISSIAVYLEWGNNKSAFIYELEFEIIIKLFKNAKGVLHPLVIIPLIGQVLLLYTLFQKQPGYKLTLLGMSLIGMLILLILFIGIWVVKLKIIISTLPFLIIAILVISRNIGTQKRN